MNSLMKILVFFMIVLVTLTSPSSSSARSFIEDFDDGSMDAVWWLEGTYAINGGIFEMIDGTNTWIRLWLEKELVNSFEADIKLGDSSQIAGIVVQWWPTHVSSPNWELYQIGLKIVSFDSQNTVFQASLGYETPNGHQLIDQVNIAPALRQQWYTLSIALNGNHVTFGIDGTETDLFHNAFPLPTNVKTGEGMVHGHDSADISYYVDNIIATSTKLGDLDYDFDVDGSDLASYIAESKGIVLQEFAANFGMN